MTSFAPKILAALAVVAIFGHVNTVHAKVCVAGALATSACTCQATCSAGQMCNNSKGGATCSSPGANPACPAATRLTAACACGTATCSAGQVCTESTSTCSTNLGICFPGTPMSGLCTCMTNPNIICNVGQTCTPSGNGNGSCA